ncbi:ubiquitin-like domain-containing protein [Tepidibacillus sp. LV47]|uniref:ubiquitin-like domain-containing protein n=1 Tax=Tepidibacillus sp. LV47 TaxID=3398228 RepID=UPI003AAFDE00
MGKLFQQTANPKAAAITLFSFLKKKKWMVFVSIVFVLIIGMSWYVQGRNKEIILIIDGQAKKVKTSMKNVQALLTEQKIDLKPQDQLSVSLDSPLKEGQIIRIEYAKPVFFNIAGEKKEVFSAAKTVEELLQQQKIPLGKLDQVQPTLQTLITPHMEVVVRRVTKKVMQIEEEIPFGYVRKADANLQKGVEKVLKKGKNGKVIKFYEITYENGKEIEKKLIKQDIVQEKNDQIVAYGTRIDRLIVSRGGYTFRSRKTLANVVITQYSGGGYTYLGTRPTPGRTIAVDPNVIPLGWWVYIEGFGLRRAEDIGGSVKGNMIDIYVDSRESALSFGKRYGYKVYIIGPNRPD